MVCHAASVCQKSGGIKINLVGWKLENGAD
jgi:hypothetical protein